MEVHLKNICLGTLPLRYKNINEQAQLTLDTLDTQRVSFAFKPWQIREKCLSAMKLALESYNPYLCNIGLLGIEYLVLHPDLDGIAGEERLDSMDSRIFVLQVLDSLNSLPNLSADQQVCGLKILLNLCCDFVSSFDGELIIKIVQMCLACWHKDKNSVHSAMIQLCAAFTMHKQKLCAGICYDEHTSTGVNCAAESLASQAVEKLAHADLSLNKNKLADVIGLAKFFIQQIKLAASDNQKGVFLECLLAVLQTLDSIHIIDNEMFGKYVRNELCPTLASSISLNTVSAKVPLLKAKKKQRIKKSKDVLVTRSAMLHRKVALLTVELVRLVGSIASLRPHVALVFSHLLSSPACTKHGIPFGILSKLWTTPDMLFNLAGPFLVQDLDVKQNHNAILQLIIDAMVLLCTEKITVDGISIFDNMEDATTSIISLLKTIDLARSGKGLTTDQIACYSNRQCVTRAEDDDSKSDVVEQADSESTIEDTSKQTNTKSVIDDHMQSSDDEDDVWLSSENIFTALSSPCYQSAAEDDSDLNELNGNTSTLFGLMKLVAKSNQTEKGNDDKDDQSSRSTASADAQNLESENEIEKYIEEAFFSEELGLKKKLTNSTEATRDSILARRHFASLKKIVPLLLEKDEVALVDQIFQKSASQFCSDIYEKWKIDKISVQAESLYVLSYSILLLCLRLKQSGHYQSNGGQLPCIKSQWVTYQQSCGVYLTKSWLSETFRQILLSDILENMQFGKAMKLIVMLEDIDGLAPVNHDFNGKLTSTSNTSMQAGNEFSHNILMSIWCDLLQILQSPLLKIAYSKETDLSSSLFHLLSPSSLRVRSEKERECILSCLNGLRRTIQLSCGLDMQAYSSTVITHLVEVCIPKRTVYEKTPTNDNNLRLHICQVLFMDTVLDVALAVGRRSSKCWDSVFRIVSYVAYLDHLCFHNNSPSMDMDKEKFFDSSSGQEAAIHDLIQENEINASWKEVSSPKSTRMGFLTHERSLKAVYTLSRNIDRFFEQAALTLDLRSLTDFFWLLCSSSDRQLFSSHSGQESLHLGTPLLYRIGEFILACARSLNRPLLHLTNLWRYAAPHFTKVLGHNNTHYAKQAGTYIYNTVTTVLSFTVDTVSDHPTSLWREQEPKYFHFIEDLLRPYERALQSELCGIEVQELIIGAISQLVETNSNRICSGWRPLFNTLKHITCNQQAMDRSPIFEVLNAFFVASSLPSVFASAAHDCINCLLKLLGSLQDESPSSLTQTTPIISYLEEVANNLLHLHEIDCKEKFTGFHNAERLPFIAYDVGVWKSLTHPIWFKSADDDLSRAAQELDDLTQKCFSNQDSQNEPNQFTVRDSTGLLHTWFHLLDGLTLRTLTSSRYLQASVLDLLCKLLHKSPSDGGFSFSCYVLLHSCLPTLLTFLERLTAGDAIDLISYKHTFGTLMELTASVILKNLQDTSTETASDAMKYEKLSEKLWHAYLNLCIACVRTRKEQLAKLACSCIKHVMTTVGKWMTSSMIDDLCACLSFVVSDCLISLNKLMSLVEQSYKVLDEIIVDKKRSESVFCDEYCLTRVFQLATYPQPQKTSHHIEIRISYSSAQENIRVCLCELACDISTLNLILKCIEYMLLGNSLSPWQRTNISHHSTTDTNGSAGLTSSLHSTSLDCTKKLDETSVCSQPLIEYLSSQQLHGLCEKVIQCFIAARKFDSLPMLQQFIQGLAGFHNAANLYQFAGLSICVYFRLLLAICCRLQITRNFVEEDPKNFSCRPICNLVTSDLLPPFHSDDEVDKITNLSLKNNSETFSWAYLALHKSVAFLCLPWDTDDSTSMGGFTFHDQVDYENDDDVEDKDSICESANSDKPSEDSKSQRSLDINLDYMAYVKRTESLPPSPSLQWQAEKNSQTKGHHRLSKELYKTTTDKFINSFLNLYRSNKSQKVSSHQSVKNRNEIENVLASDFMTSHRRCNLSGKTYQSVVVALDEQLLKRQAWSSTVESILRLLTSAPDSVLNVLLPIIYQPLTSLANHRPLSNPLIVNESGNDVGDAFHKWLLRIGQFCQFVPSKA